MSLDHDDFAPTQVLTRCAALDAAPACEHDKRVGGMDLRLRPALLPGLALCLLLGSCSSAPKPPTVDESRKRPANTQALVDLQACRSDLQNQRMVHKDDQRQVEASQALVRLLAMQLASRPAVMSASAASIPASASDAASAPIEAASAAARDPAATACRRAVSTEPGEAPALRPNGVYTAHFEFGSTALQWPAGVARALVDEAREAPLVLLRGRTDGTGEAWAEARIARERAEAVRDFLIARGVPAQRIRTTWQASGDHAADNRTAWGRDLNRRVEIEIYRVAPVTLNPAVSAQR